MPWMKWLPWRFLVRRVARAHGFLDPIALLARLHRFAQPSEVGEPIELLRAGVVFHARGLINSRVIQHNLDWVWPYWVERQFNPKDDAFVPRAFSITHVNLTHRNWTAVGQPDCPELPIVDPRGLLTPLYDGWSLDAWIVTDDGRELLPSRARSATQTLDMTDQLAVVTQTHQDGLAMQTASSVQLEQGLAACHLALQAHSVTPGWLVLALRPYNPEGISFIHEVILSPERTGWTIDQHAVVEFDTSADRHHVSDYRSGDVRIHLQELDDQRVKQCDVGMATAAAMFRLDAGKPRDVLVRVPLGDRRKVTPVANPSWQESLRGQCELRIPDQRLQFLYDAALRTLVLHSPGDVYPGPYTYKRFWFRDAAFIIYGLLCAGLIERAERALDRFPSRQTALGYFHSQEGEWDANGEVLWIMHQFCRLIGQPPKPDWYTAVVVDRGRVGHPAGDGEGRRSRIERAGAEGPGTGNDRSCRSDAAAVAPATQPQRMAGTLAWIAGIRFPEPLVRARQRTAGQLAKLPETLRLLELATVPYRVEISAALHDLAKSLDAATA